MLIGIIGTSEIARQHARAVKKFGHQVVFANSGNSESPNTIKCRNEFPDCPQVNLETLLYKHDCDSIISCLPVTLVDYYFDELYAYNKPILFEKPPYINKSSILVQSKKNNQHRVGFNKRFFTSVKALKNKVMQEAPMHVALTISESSSAHKYDRLNSQKLNYLYYSSSSHLLDLALYLFGASDKVNFRSVTTRSNIHCGYVGTIKFFNGIYTEVSILVDDPVRIGISCLFMNGERWVLSPLEQLTIYKGYSISVRQNINSYTPRVEFKVKTDINSEIRPGIQEQMKAFIDKVDGTLATFNQYQDFVSLISKISKS